ncbi:MAG: hypothetical protein V3S31_04785 [Dehalococcoidia bacterium]
MLEDYPREAPLGVDDGTGWACPVALPPPEVGAGEAEQLVHALREELSRLQPWYEESRRGRGRTTVGVSGIDAEAIGSAADVLARSAGGETVAPPDGAVHDLPVLYRFLADDVKAYYFEAAAAQPARVAPTSDELARWLFTETVLGDVLFRLRERFAASDDQAERWLQGVIVPVAYQQLGRS